MYPLEDLKVIELARVLAGPWIGQTLADLGADVMKVESPEGDDTRDWGANIITKGNDKSAAYFHSTNRGKQGITVNFNNSDQLAELKSMIASADVVIENFNSAVFAVVLVFCWLAHKVATRQRCIQAPSDRSDAVAPSQRVVQRRPHRLAARRIRRLSHDSIGLLLR